MLCLELGQRIIRLPLEQPNAEIMIRVLQSPSGLPHHSGMEQTDLHLAQHILPKTLVQQCHPEWLKGQSSSLCPSLLATITNLRHMYGHKTEAHSKTQASKMLLVMQAALLHLRALHTKT